MHNDNDSLTSFAISPDGRRIVVGVSNKTLRIWDVESGQEIATIAGHSQGVRSCAFSPDGRQIVTGSWDKTLKIWDVETGLDIAILSGHNRDVLCCAYSPDGRRIVSGSMDGTLKIWDAETGNEIATLFGHGDYVTCCAFSPDCHRIVSGSYDKTLKVWDTTIEEEIPALNKGHSKEVFSCTFSPGGSRIISGGGYQNEELKLWDAENGSEIATLGSPSSEIPNCGFKYSFSPDGSRIITCGGDYGNEELILWDAKSGTKMATLYRYKEKAATCAFSPDGRRIISGDGGYTRILKLLETDTGKEIFTFECGGYPLASCNFSPDGYRIVTDGSGATLLDANTGKKITFEYSSVYIDNVTYCSFSPDGSRIIERSNINSVQIIYVNSGESKWIVSGEAAGNIERYEVTSSAFCPQGTRIVTGSADGSARIWNQETGNITAVHNIHIDNITSCAFSPDGKRIFSVSKDKTLKHWDADTGQIIDTFLCDSPILCFAISGCGTKIAFGDSIGNIYLLKLEGSNVGAPIFTGNRPCVFDPKSSSHTWSSHILGECPICVARFRLSSSLLDTITAINRSCNISLTDSACGKLPKEAWNDPRLLIDCPKCGGKIKSNPFIVDNKKTQINFEYQKHLIKWKALPWWQRLKVSKPKPPE